MSENKPLSFYINESNNVNLDIFSKKIKLAILSSFTINGLAECIKVKSSLKDIGCQIYESGYNQYNQEIFNTDSNLYKFSPDLTILILDIRSIFGDIFYNPYTLSDNERIEFVKNRFQEITTIINSFKKNSNAKLLVTNLNFVSFSPYGIAEQKTNFNFNEMIGLFNDKLKREYIDDNFVLIYDFSNFVLKYGEKNVFNYKNYFFGNITISFEFIPFLADDILSFLIAINGKTKKCIVLDLDNTLWGGIVGEDGFDGIQLGPNAPGNAYMEFQKYLKSLAQRGILLAINSKNNYDDAMKIISEHPFMILRKNDFSSIKINWDNKVSNMKEIANEVNIGTDSFVFFDDDPVNRSLIKNTLPEIVTPELPSDPSYYVEILQSLPDFSLIRMTYEDKNRKKMYQEQENRKKQELLSDNLEDFLRSLNLKVIIKDSTSFTIPRISQLTLKTNQFNLTTKRYQEEEIKKFSEDKNVLIKCAQVKDKFGDSGITGTFIVKKDSEEWIIDTFLLSCRVIGREIEKAMMDYIINESRKSGVKKILAQYIQTEKNSPIEDFLPKSGFEKNGDYWVYDVEKQLKVPSFLSIEIEK